MSSCTCCLSGAEKQAEPQHQGGVDLLLRVRAHSLGTTEEGVRQPYGTLWWGLATHHDLFTSLLGFLLVLVLIFTFSMAAWGFHVESITCFGNAFPHGAAAGEQESGSGGHAAPPMPTHPPPFPHLVLDSGFWFCGSNLGLPTKVFAVPEIQELVVGYGERWARSRLFSSSQDPQKGLPCCCLALQGQE